MRIRRLFIRLVLLAVFALINLCVWFGSDAVFEALSRNVVRHAFRGAHGAFMLYELLHPSVVDMLGGTEVVSSGHDRVSVEARAFGRMMRATIDRTNPDYHKVRMYVDLFSSIHPTPSTATYAHVSISSDVSGEWVHNHPALVASAESSANDDGDRSPVILHCHGGGFTSGSVRHWRHYASQLSNATGYRVFNVEYRLAPEYPLPAAVDDAYSAYLFLRNKGIDRIALSGDSAGGGLVLLLVQRLIRENLPIPDVVAASSPWTDLSLSGDSLNANADDDFMLFREALQSCTDYSVGNAPSTSPLVSAFFGSFTGFPPTYLQAGTSEVLLDDTRRVAKKLRTAGVDVREVIVDGMMHVLPFWSEFIPEGKAVMADIGSFIREHVQSRIR